MHSINCAEKNIKLASKLYDNRSWARAHTFTTHTYDVRLCVRVRHSHIALNMRGKSRQKIFYICSAAVNAYVQWCNLSIRHPHRIWQGAERIRMRPRSFSHKSIKMYTFVRTALVRSKPVAHVRWMNQKSWISNHTCRCNHRSEEIEILDGEKIWLELIKRHSPVCHQMSFCGVAIVHTEHTHPCVKMLCVDFRLNFSWWLCTVEVVPRYQFFEIMQSSSMRNIGAKSFGFNIEQIEWSNRMDLIAFSNNKSG